MTTWLFIVLGVLGLAGWGRATGGLYADLTKGVVLAAHSANNHLLFASP